MKNKVLPTFIATCVLILFLSMNTFGLLKSLFFVGLYFFMYYETLIGEKKRITIWLFALLKGVVVMVFGYITLGESWDFALIIFYPIIFIFLLGLPLLALYQPKENHNLSM
ncbi:hypothetical protein ABE65_012055 [Fictibacillus phosphorivorans]|uniref:Uncharacterized protein n=1 Tax=Fictibacillus phosphorivorans TaxID=1221500 RepID=A0A160INM7_9BACL|nr:hypothetical protein [Fictibacillus phosphorivorans]ANC77490.1 hypothetical protein ABE65_012055 [Fictibacillus phosphorivorans]